MRLTLCLIALVLLAACAPPRLILQEHPLAGRIWDPAERRFISPQEAEDRIAAADFALLGEIHDNPAHHHIQTQLLGRMVARGKRPALAMEQFDTEWQSAIDAANASGATATAVAQAGHLAGGWEWHLYRPMVALAVKERLPIVAANLSRPRARTIASGGVDVLGKGEPERLALDQPWSTTQNATLRSLLVAGHCGEDSPMIDKLIHVQRSKDATMADRILAGKGGAVAIVGRSHARADIGVPLYLKARAPEKRLLSLGLLEVEEDRVAPGDYPDAAAGLHDLVWFTPRSRRPDSCETFQGMSRTAQHGA